MKFPPEESQERLFRRAHAILILFLILGIAVWLFRTYGFAPLRFSPASRTVAP